MRILFSFPSFPFFYFFFFFSFSYFGNFSLTLMSILSWLWSWLWWWWRWWWKRWRWWWCCLLLTLGIPFIILNIIREDIPSSTSQWSGLTISLFTFSLEIIIIATLMIIINIRINYFIIIWIIIIANGKNNNSFVCGKQKEIETNSEKMKMIWQGESEKDEMEVTNDWYLGDDEVVCCHFIGRLYKYI